MEMIPKNVGLLSHKTTRLLQASNSTAPKQGAVSQNHKYQTISVHFQTQKKRIGVGLLSGVFASGTALYS